MGVKFQSRTFYVFQIKLSRIEYACSAFQKFVINCDIQAFEVRQLQFLVERDSFIKVRMRNCDLCGVYKKYPHSFLLWTFLGFAYCCMFSEPSMRNCNLCGVYKKYPHSFLLWTFLGFAYCCMFSEPSGLSDAGDYPYLLAMYNKTLHFEFLYHFEVHTASWRLEFFHCEQNLKQNALFLLKRILFLYLK